MNMSSSEPGPCPPTVNGIESMSFQLLTLEVRQVTHTDVSLLTLPIQVKRRESNLLASVPSSGSIDMPRPTMPNVVPSLGATL